MVTRSCKRTTGSAHDAHVEQIQPARSDLDVARLSRCKPGAVIFNKEAPVQVYIYRWNRCGRKGQRCKVIARGTMNSCLLEFEDGWRMVTSRNAIMKAK